MDLSNSELIDSGLETPVNKENLTEDEKLLMEKDEKIHASEPWSALVWTGQLMYISQNDKKRSLGARPDTSLRW